jgi:RNA polymerase sigma factor (sigma-70 family)
MNSPFSRTLRRVRVLLGAPAGGELTDRDLLERFSTSRDEAAFETLVRRHGSAVLGICQRVLGNAEDAEDAFQAAFLILARKAESVRWQASGGGWLYQVAYHVAIRARRAQARRRTHELRAPPMESCLSDAVVESDLRPIIDDELQRLPEKFRLPLLLCYLQGKTREEAAELLGWTPGEVKGRLERGREMLRGRLVRRGLVASGVILPGVFTCDAIAVPTKLISATVHAAVSGSGSVAVNELMKGALHVMFWNKLKKVGLVVGLVALLGGGGMLGMIARPVFSTARAVPVPPTSEIEIKDNPGISWGEARGGIRLGLSPRTFSVKADQNNIVVTAWFENVGKQDRQVQPWDELFGFHGKKGEQKFEVEYSPGARAAWPPAPPPITLKPGERTFVTLWVPFEGPKWSNAYAGLLRPTAAKPLTLTGHWKTKPADALESGSIQVRMKGDK